MSTQAIAKRKPRTASLGRLLKSERKRRMMTQVDFAELLGTTERTMKRWEHGSVPRPEALHEIAERLGWALSFVIEAAEPLRRGK